MTTRLTLLILTLAITAACDSAPGSRHLEVHVAPEKVLDFDTLYATNCTGCHGTEGRGGAAPGLANPTYLAIDFAYGVKYDNILIRDLDAPDPADWWRA